MLAIVSAVKEGGLKRHFSAEREIFKLMFAFDHINYAGCITYQHLYLNNLLRKDNSIVKDLITNEHGALCFGDTFPNIHRDKVNEHFNKETKGTAVHFPSGYSTDIYLCSKQMDKNFPYSQQDANNVAEEIKSIYLASL